MNLFSRNSKYYEWLPAYLEDGLDEARQAQMKARLAADPALAAEAERLRRTIQHLQEARAREQAPANASVPTRSLAAPSASGWNGPQLPASRPGKSAGSPVSARRLLWPSLPLFGCRCDFRAGNPGENVKTPSVKIAQVRIRRFKWRMTPPKAIDRPYGPARICHDCFPLPVPVRWRWSGRRSEYLPIFGPLRFPARPPCRSHPLQPLAL